MPQQIYSRLNRLAHRTAREFFISHLGMEGGWSGWQIDPGRLEDGIGETLRTAANGIHLMTGTLSCKFGASWTGCSHGLSGIFGMRFVEALAKDGRTLCIDIDYTVDGNRLTFTNYQFSLV